MPRWMFGSEDGGVVVNRSSLSMLGGGMLAGSDEPFRWEVRTSSDNFREAILEVLENNPEGVGKTAIRQAVTGQHEKIDAALSELEDEGRLIKGDRNKYFLADE